MCLHKFDIYQGISAETLDVLISFEKKKVLLLICQAAFFRKFIFPRQKEGE